MQLRIRKWHNCVYYKWGTLLALGYMHIILQTLITRSYFSPQDLTSVCTQKGLCPCKEPLFEILFSAQSGWGGPRPYLLHIIQTWLWRFTHFLMCFSLGLSLHCPRASPSQDHLFSHTPVKGGGIFIPILWVNNWGPLWKVFANSGCRVWDIHSMTDLCLYSTALVDSHALHLQL